MLFVEAEGLFHKGIRKWRGGRQQAGVSKSSSLLLLIAARPGFESTASRIRGNWRILRIIG